MDAGQGIQQAYELPHATQPAQGLVGGGSRAKNFFLLIHKLHGGHALLFGQAKTRQRAGGLPWHNIHLPAPVEPPHKICGLGAKGAVAIKNERGFHFAPDSKKMERNIKCLSIPHQQAQIGSPSGD